MNNKINQCNLLINIFEVNEITIIKQFFLISLKFTLLRKVKSYLDHQGKKKHAAIENAFAAIITHRKKKKKKA